MKKTNSSLKQQKESYSVLNSKKKDYTVSKLKIKDKHSPIHNLKFYNTHNIMFKEMKKLTCFNCGEPHQQQSKEDYWQCNCGSYHKGFPYRCKIRRLIQILDDMVHTDNEKRFVDNVIQRWKNG